MIEQILKWEAKVEDKVSHWIFPNNLPLQVLEQMALQFLQGLGKIKEQQAQAALDAEKEKADAKHEDSKHEDPKEQVEHVAHEVS